eukprot:9467115-Lingulodinium_polyedra.AAC.1
MVMRDCLGMWIMWMADSTVGDMIQFDLKLPNACSNRRLMLMMGGRPRASSRSSTCLATRATCSRCPASA